MFIYHCQKKNYLVNSTHSQKYIDKKYTLWYLNYQPISGNMHPDFIAKRFLALQEYINIVLMNPILASSLPAKKFVDPETYNQTFLGKILI